MPKKISHDAIFKRVFTVPGAAAALVRPSLSQALAERIDWTQLKILSNEFHSASLGSQLTDAVFSAPIAGPRNREAMIHLHLEHQSQNDASMILRTLSYAGGLLLAHHRSQTPPPDPPRPPLILQFVVSHDPKGWRAATSLRELYDYDDDFSALSHDRQIHHRYSVIDLSHLDNDQLRARAADAWSALILFALREARNSRFLRHLSEVADLVEAVAKMPDGHQRFHDFACYVLTVNPDKSMTGLSVTQTLANAGESASKPAKSAWELMQEDLIGRGREEGREEGLEQARVSTAMVLADLLRERFGKLSAGQQTRIRDASLAQLQTWIRSCATVESLDQLFA